MSILLWIIILHPIVGIASALYNDLGNSIVRESLQWGELITGCFVGAVLGWFTIPIAFDWPDMVSKFWHAPVFRRKN